MTEPSPTDAELIAASRRGERAAFGALVDRHHGAVCAVTYSATRDRALAEDVAQDTFVAAWQQLHRLRDIERLRPWLCQIARNLASKARRRRARETPALDLDAVAPATPFDTISDRQTEVVVAAALARVPDTLREVLVLFYADQQSARMVAATLGISETAVHQRLSRGRALLAGDVAGTVERALAGRRTRRNLAATVLAALPVLGAATHAHAATKGSSAMLKFGVAGCVVALAVGTGAYVVERTSAAAPSAPTKIGPVADATRDHSRDATAQPSRAPSRPHLADPRQLRRDQLPEWIQHGVAGVAAPIRCEQLAKHALQINVDAMPLTPAQAASFATDHPATVNPWLDGVIQKCEHEDWSQAFRACAMASTDAIAQQIDCAKYAGATPKHAPPPPRPGVEVSCAQVATTVAHALEPAMTSEPNTDQSKEYMATSISALAQSCVDHGWSPELRACLTVGINAGTDEAFDNCIE